MRIRLHTAIALLTIAPFCYGEKVTVSNHAIELPPPPGMKIIEPGELSTFLNSFIPPGNRRLGAFFGENAALAAVPDRLCSAQVNQRMENFAFSDRDFLEFRNALKNQVLKNPEKIKRIANSAYEHSTDEYNAAHDRKLSISTASLSPLAPHIDNSQMISFTMNAVNQVTNGEQVSGANGVVTNTALRVGPSVIFLYCTGKDDDAQWTRDESIDWANEILKYNKKAN